MATSSAPLYREFYPLNELPYEHLFVLALEALALLKWKVTNLGTNGVVASTHNGLFAWNAEIKIVLENGGAVLQSTSAGGELVDEEKNKKVVTRLTETLTALRQKYTPDELTGKYYALRNDIYTGRARVLTAGTLTGREQLNDILSIFKPTHGYFITPILLNLNIIVFLLMAMAGVNVMTPESVDLLHWGANFGPLTLAGEWWRLVTCCFVHIGLMHLLMNMYALAFIGLLLEPKLGKSRFLAAYLLTGIAGSMVSTYSHGHTISAGASGAIFGMYGVFLALLTTPIIEKASRKKLLLSIGFFVVYNLLNGFKPGIDNAAHIGGLLSGIAAGYVFLPGLKQPRNSKLKLAAIAILSVLIISVSAAVYFKLSAG
ncbi:MAG: rhomboid family intramembrane serine protease [Taibaiella sp.]|nr:rhomboid family intramembrane serine protease [Taibaiella sp.]